LAFPFCKNNFIELNITMNFPQAECEELARRVEELKSENSALRTELTRLQEECEKLTAKNNSLTEELKNVHNNESRETRVKDELENADTEQ